MSSRLLYKLLRNKHFRFGAPFLTFVFGFPYFFQDVVKVAFESKRDKPLTQEEIDEYKEKGILLRKEEDLNLKEELKKSQARVKDDYLMVRGPRPWEPETLQQLDKIPSQLP